MIIQISNNGYPRSECDTVQTETLRVRKNTEAAKVSGENVTHATMRDEVPQETYKSSKIITLTVLSITILIAVLNNPHHSAPSHDTGNKINDVIITDFNTIPLTFQWRNLSPKELQEWYRPVDFCMLRSDSAMVSTKSFFFNNCSSDHDRNSRAGHSSVSGRDNGALPRPMTKVDQGFCGPGMGSRGQCPSPLKTRDFFYRALQGYDQAVQKPLLALAISLRTHQQDLIFIGDSLMRQNTLAFLCELQRERVVVRTSHVDASCHQVYTLRGQVRVMFLQIGRLHSVDNRCETNIGGRNRSGPGSFSYVRSVVRERQLQKV